MQYPIPQKKVLLGTVYGCFLLYLESLGSMMEHNELGIIVPFSSWLLLRCHCMV